MNPNIFVYFIGMVAIASALVAGVVWLGWVTVSIIQLERGIRNLGDSSGRDVRSMRTYTDKLNDARRREIQGLTTATDNLNGRISDNQRRLRLLEIQAREAQSEKPRA